MRAKKSMRLLGTVLLHFLIAVFGITVISMPIHASLSNFFPPRTINSVLAREYFLSIVIAVLFGFLVYRSWKAEAAKWIGIVGISMFVARAVMVVASAQGTVWFQMMGEACVEGTRATGCINYFTVTISAVRTVCYSVGAWICWYLRASGNFEIGRAVFADFRNPFVPSNPEDSTSKDSAD